MESTDSSKSRRAVAAGSPWPLSSGWPLWPAWRRCLTSIQTHKSEQVQYPLKVVQVAANELDPAVWGKNFPREYDSFLKTKDDTIKTTLWRARCRSVSWSSARP